jgi:hypothetical protein
MNNKQFLLVWGKERNHEKETKPKTYENIG